MSQTRFSVLIHQQAKKYGDRVALKHRDYKTNTWIPTTWNQFSETVAIVSNALIELGVGVQENIGVFTQNKPESLFMDFGAFGVRAVTVPLYATSSEAQVHYILEDAQIRYLFVGEQQQYDVAFRVMALSSTLKQIVVFDRDVKFDARDESTIYMDDFLAMGKNRQHQAEVDKRTAESDTEDLMNILYTSGTTGESKGVMLSHAGYESVMDAHCERFPGLGENDVIINFLPFTHVFERAWSCWCLCVGAELNINLRPQDIQMTIKEVRPTAMCSVPRFWEKVYAGVTEVINGATGVKKTLMQDAIKVGREHNVEYVCKGKTAPLWLHMKYKFYEKTIYSLLKKTLGLDRGAFFPTAGAAIPPAVQDFVLSVGINMVAGYGLTESIATVSCENNFDHMVGSVGKLMPHMQVKFGENDEILLKGPAITKGYYKKEAATKAAFTEDGWFRTGDAGYMKDGFLFLTERIKDLFKTSNGKYIAPQAIETKMVVDRYIDQISIIADERKFVAALIVPDYKLVEKYAADKGIQYASMAELLKHDTIMELFKERIDTLQQQFAHYEQIKRFTLLPEPFSMAKGELTNTLKIKRSVLNKNYAAEIEAMYAE
ncbi:MAG: long-chain fatty acid--CoA ligase [Bacteroides sp.]|nr:long-chain fatty acid--CoA ligase [Bacteroides sp.]MBQ8874013.1 long-chain fatty acid--CoA ligase [Bacteroides sp.]